MLGIGAETGVWRTLDAAASPGADQPRFEQIELGSTVHLPLHELEAGDLPLGLAIRPRLDQRRRDSCSVLRARRRTVRSIVSRLAGTTSRWAKRSAGLPPRARPR